MFLFIVSVVTTQNAFILINMSEHGVHLFIVVTFSFFLLLKIDYIDYFSYNRS